MSISLGKHVTLTKPDDFGKLLEDEGIIFTQLDKAVNWARKSSIWPLGFGLACCAIEMMSMAQQAKPKDRKSTRLNSSHQIISYAVFCLKKKKYKKIVAYLAAVTT